MRIIPAARLYFKWIRFTFVRELNNANRKSSQNL